MEQLADTIAPGLSGKKSGQNSGHVTPRDVAWRESRRCNTVNKAPSVVRNGELVAEASSFPSK